MVPKLLLGVLRGLSKGSKSLLPTLTCCSLRYSFNYFTLLYLLIYHTLFFYYYFFEYYNFFFVENINTKLG